MSLGHLAVVELDDRARALPLGMIIGVHRIARNATRPRIEPEDQKGLATGKPHRAVRGGSDLSFNRAIGVVFGQLGPSFKLLTPRVKPSVSALAESGNPQVPVAVELDRERPRRERRF